MHIPSAVIHLFPGADPLADFEVRDDGEGPYIAVWNLPDPQPTLEQLEAAWADYEANKPPDPPSEIEHLQARLDASETDNAAILLELAQTQARLDQSEQDQAALILSLVEGGVL